jgi:phosphoribosylformylglycinamidine synthase subunit PurQ / glutaminase
MSTRVIVLRAPGTNCDVETAYAFERAGARVDRIHVNRLLESPKLLAEYQVLCLPGGFSYGDDIAAGRILGNQLRHHLAGQLEEFKAAGKLILGICNGFQILIKSGVLLPLNGERGVLATLTWNDSGRYTDRWVNLEVASSKSPFFAGMERMYLPIAHAEGKFVPRDEEALCHLEANGQLVLRYRSDDNPNGAIANVAGLCDETGRVCGLMPHPERHLDPTQHPRWTREPMPAVGDGLRVFQNAVRFFS